MLGSAARDRPRRSNGELEADKPAEPPAARPRRPSGQPGPREAPRLGVRRGAGCCCGGQGVTAAAEGIRSPKFDSC